MDDAFGGRMVKKEEYTWVGLLFCSNNNKRVSLAIEIVVHMFF
jgi:hypothetical protein